MPIIERVIQP
ncbi:Protein of unknown function [Lactobacillus helveticus CIRM-BIA 951]|uniref:Uncharacterized protein n=2 Tax=Lactobacillus helveticus TaxID=1587 RepID=U4QN81_LACHE|nr:Protein of unknown function [Lactobacillus helveticus CIRM-BIA 953]CDI59062.1 Protein of unknown function [Lactobacillus helveticus CIRM-BIA 951]